MTRSPSWLAALFATALAATACGGAPDAGAEAPAAAATPERPRDAHVIATNLIGGRVSALVHVARVRSHPVGPRLVALGDAQSLLAGTGLDALRDLERVFVSAPGADQPRAVLFAEHNLDDAGVDRAIEAMVVKAGGARVPGVPYRAVRVKKGGRSGVVGFHPPRFLAVVPDDLEAGLAAFAETGGLPGPEGEEAASLVALDPHHTLRAHGAPRVPGSISSALATVTLEADGGAVIDAEGQSANPAQAQEDAATLQAAIERATTVQLGFVKVRVFRTVPFRADGDRVRSTVNLSRGELDQILSLAGAAIR